MPPKDIYTTVDGRKLKLTNSDKVLFPDAQIVKAAYIKYLLDISHYILPLIKNRPLTLIRYPDGIAGKKFYSKNKPSWTPEWVASTFFPGDEENEYILTIDRATLAWIGNLAALEIHPMNVRTPSLLYPDQFIFDLDPSTEIDFTHLKELAWNLKIFLEKKGFVPFIKTSGGKGLHIYVPVKPIQSTDEVYAFTKKIAQEYVRNHDKTTTLKISKAQRKGKVLLDIYRNARSQSCVAPYSIRAKPHAPISTPFDWSLLEKLESSKQWNMSNIFHRLETHNNAWQNFRESEASITTKPQSNRLEKYEQKRDFTVTPEPSGKESIQTSGHDFVIQLHDANKLHYDLRLEENGTLKSWAIPKGLPIEPGIKRLAIQTEDHPLKYLTFEGEIPADEYGGGTMWIFDRGTYTLLKKSKNKYTFKLAGFYLQGSYSLYRTNENQWLVERKDEVRMDIKSYLTPMLAQEQQNIPKGNDYFYEIKWDGIRIIIVLNQGKVELFSRNGNNLTDQFPKLQDIASSVDASFAIMDGEIVHLDNHGKPLFHKVVSRIHTKGNHRIAQAADHTPAVIYLFDLLFLNGRDCRNLPNKLRRAWLATILKTDETVRFSESFQDGNLLFEAIKEQGMEGVIAKKIDGKYQNGVRSSAWKKVKVRHLATVSIIGYTAGEGDRAGSIGALHLGEKTGSEWLYRGKVGTGFNQSDLKELENDLFSLQKVEKPVNAKIDEAHRTTWIPALYKCEIKYASLSSNHTFREPVFIKFWKVAE